MAADDDLDIAEVYRVLTYYYDNIDELQAFESAAPRPSTDSERSIRQRDVA